ncbi:hypothetical protein SELMODRAFT_419714 [Selaginella moellendorffii]|uniref:SGNH hydrolase-type esterase domain-containing protein n=1 Tax=Selaginella moellendorffii TaxID=88036 RepID=D8S9T8_SELML|nr:hypothetical protein SELMODRAFT_419714 [Selaginella moellendorffii]
MKTSSKILVFLFAILALCACVYGRSVPQLRTIYMGDSIFDVGTNKYVKNSVSRCDFVPYGKTRYNQPSGRCSDGFLIPDLINKVIGLPFSKPFLGLKDWGVVSFNEQLKQLGQLANKIPMMNLNDFVVVISSGGNDIAANLQNLANVDLEAMLVSLEKGLEQLYKYGFRKIVYSSLGPLGCVPIVTSDGNCVREINDLVEQFNWQARAIVLGVAKKFPGMRGAFVDGYSLIKSYVENPNKFGFQNGGGCCPNCLSHKNTLSGLCRNPSDYVFWDLIHPTEHTAFSFTELATRQKKAAEWKHRIHPSPVLHCELAFVRHQQFLSTSTWSNMPLQL